MNQLMEYPDPFGARDHVRIGDRSFALYRLERAGMAALDRAPVTVRVLLENALRNAGRDVVTEADVRTLAAWRPGSPAEAEVPFLPARVLLQDFTGVPAVVDLAAMRDAMSDLGGDPARINPLVPADLVIDHSVQVDRYRTPDAFAFNVDREYERNGERYQLLRWAQSAFRDLRVVPPGTGIVHQVNLEYLAQVVVVRELDGEPVAFPDTLVGTDSHTTMVNALGVLGYGVGGIEAEAVLLGQPLYQPMPRVVGVRLHGELPRGTTATDLVLVISQMLRKHGVVGAFVEFAGDGLASLALADRATISNMSPEYGATAALFPIDDETLAYLRLTGRDADHVALVEAYAKEAGLWRLPGPGPDFDESLELDLATVEPSVAGPRRPQDRVPLSGLRENFRGHFPSDAIVEFTVGRRGTRGACPRGRRRRRPGIVGGFLPGQRRAVVRTGTGVGRAIRARRGGSAGDRAGARLLPGTPGRDRRGARRPAHRVRRDRGHHQLHEHVEPDRDGGRRPVGTKRRGSRAHRPSDGQDQPCAGLARRDRVPGRRRAHGPAGAARLRPGRLRVHHVHRQQRPARRADRPRGRGARPRRRGRALRQPQLRGSHPPAGTCQLPGLSPARRGVRAGRARRHRPLDRAARPGLRRPARLPRGPLARRRGDPFGDRRRHRSRPVPAHLRERLRRRRSLAGAAGADRRPVRLGCGIHLHRAAAVPRGHHARGRGRHRHPGRAGPRRARRLGDHRPHLAGRVDPGVEPGRNLAAGSTAWRLSTSTATVRAAATTRS